MEYKKVPGWSQRADEPTGSARTAGQPLSPHADRELPTLSPTNPQQNHQQMWTVLVTQCGPGSLTAAPALLQTHLVATSRRIHTS